MIFWSPVSFLIFAARLVSRIGAYVSGNERTKGSVTAAKRVVTPNAHLQVVFSAIKPESGGAMTGPTPVATMKMAIVFPLIVGSALMSANMPPTVVSGAEAAKPQMNLKRRKVAHVGATAQAMVNKVYRMKEMLIIGFRPQCSESGLQKNGAIT